MVVGRVPFRYSPSWPEGSSRIATGLSAIRDADIIAVMRYGRIVTRGTHDEPVHEQGAHACPHAAHAGLMSGD